jgi:hypothetical protein
MRFQRLSLITAFFWTAAVSFFNVYGPIYSLATEGSTPAGEQVRMPIVLGYQTGLEGGAAWIAFVVIIPFLLASAPLLIHRREARVISGTLLLVFCVVGATSIGLLYLPAAILLIASGLAKPKLQRLYAQSNV